MVVEYQMRNQENILIRGLRLVYISFKNQSFFVKLTYIQIEYYNEVDTNSKFMNFDS